MNCCSFAVAQAGNVLIIVCQLQQAQDILVDELVRVERPDVVEVIIAVLKQKHTHSYEITETMAGACGDSSYYTTP